MTIVMAQKLVAPQKIGPMMPKTAKTDVSPSQQVEKLDQIPTQKIGQADPSQAPPKSEAFDFSQEAPRAKTTTDKDDECKIINIGSVIGTLVNEGSAEAAQGPKKGDGQPDAATSNAGGATPQPNTAS